MSRRTMSYTRTGASSPFPLTAAVCARSVCRAFVTLSRSSRAMSLHDRPAHSKSTFLLPPRNYSISATWTAGARAAYSIALTFSLVSTKKHQLGGRVNPCRSPRRPALLQRHMARSCGGHKRARDYYRPDTRLCSRSLRKRSSFG